MTDRATDVSRILVDAARRSNVQFVYGRTVESVEKQFDDIAEGKLVWSKMIDEFYRPFHTTIEDALTTSERARGERLLGTDPATGKTVSAKIGRFGPFVQVGEAVEGSDEERQHL